VRRPNMLSWKDPRIELPCRTVSVLALEPIPLKRLVTSSCGTSPTAEVKVMLQMYPPTSPLLLLLLLVLLFSPMPCSLVTPLTVLQSPPLAPDLRAGRRVFLVLVTSTVPTPAIKAYCSFDDDDDGGASTEESRDGRGIWVGSGLLAFRSKKLKPFMRSWRHSACPGGTGFRSFSIAALTSAAVASHAMRCVLKRPAK